MRRSTYADIKLKHDAEKSVKVSQQLEKQDLDSPVLEDSKHGEIQEEFKRTNTQELNDMCLESHQKIIKPRKKALRPMDTYELIDNELKSVQQAEEEEDKEDHWDEIEKLQSKTLYGFFGQ